MLSRCKMIMLSIFLMIVLSLTACGGESGTSSKNELSLGETAKNKNWEFTLTNVEFCDAIAYSSLAHDYNDSDFFSPADAYYQRSSGKLWKNAESGKTYFTFSFSLKYVGKETKNANVPKDITLIYEDYSFSNTNVALLKSDGYWTESSLTFEPLSNTYSGRGYLQVSDKIDDEENAEYKLEINLYGDKIKYAFTSTDAIPDITTAYANDDLIEKAEAFGDDDGDIHWEEASFPYFIDMREAWPKLTTEEIQNGIVGKWNVREYTDRPTMERYYTFSSGGTGTYVSALNGNEKTLYWDAKDDSFVYSLRKIENTMTYSEVRAASDDIWVMYRKKDMMPIVVLTRQ